jgi:hypothetical protein
MEETLKSCCEEFGRAMGRVGSCTDPQIERDDLTDGTPAYSIGGCCHGGCFVASDCLYCPWCGKRVEAAAGDEDPYAAADVEDYAQIREMDAEAGKSES